MQKKYVTTTLPYVNSKLHVGHAMEFVRADTLVRFFRQKGFEVFFNTGSDEHGQKIYDTAVEKGIDPKEYCDEIVEQFKETQRLINMSTDHHFIRTTDAHHIKAAQEFWRRVKENGFIEKRNYQTKYCVGCELEKTDSELVHGQCPHHPGKQVQLIDEENYFFKFSAFGDQLLSYYESNPTFIRGEGRMNEMKALVKSGLQDFSVSRLASKMSWGIPVPDDNEHVMYVWFDALVNYISTLGWPEDIQSFDEYWVLGDTYQYAGKDNTRQQSAMWQAMLLAAGLPLTKHIHINGFINGEGGVKMSKTIGNVIDPSDIIGEYGTDMFRYFVLRHIPSFEDGDMNLSLYKEIYNAHLVNGLGNVVNRVLTLSDLHVPNIEMPELARDIDIDTLFETGHFDRACDAIWKKIGDLNEFISNKEPFKVVKVDHEAGVLLITQAYNALCDIAQYIAPIMPQTYEVIIEAIKENKKPEAALFPRK